MFRNLGARTLRISKSGLSRFHLLFLQAHSNEPGEGMTLAISPRILAKRIAISLLAVLALVYCGDFLYLRVRMLHPKPADPFETQTTLRVLAIPEKNGKTEFEVDSQNPEQTVTCVHSLFPHSGFSPCWFVKPKINQPIPM
jgi:hypothetical protein